MSSQGQGAPSIFKCTGTSEDNGFWKLNSTEKNLWLVDLLSMLIAFITTEFFTFVILHSFAMSIQLYTSLHICHWLLQQNTSTSSYASIHVFHPHVCSQVTSSVKSCLTYIANVRFLPTVCPYVSGQVT